jgi:hypothetical protein
VPVAPAASRAIVIEAHERSHYRFTGIIPAFPAQWFYGFLRALPGVPSLLATVDTGTGYQDHTTSPYAAVPSSAAPPTSHRIPRPTSVTIAIRPSQRARDGGGYAGDLGQARREIFFAMGLDSHSGDLPVGQIRLKPKENLFFETQTRMAAIPIRPRLEFPESDGRGLSSSSVTRALWRARQNAGIARPRSQGISARNEIAVPAPKIRQ